jgi:hypothetical protein
MRYMFLVYSRETEMADASADEITKVRAGHWAVINATKRRGVLRDCAPLRPTDTATTLRVEHGRPLVLDGPFAETKEQLAGYYILDCADLDEAIGWAAQIPTSCKGGEGCVEIRPIGEIPPL